MNKKSWEGRLAFVMSMLLLLKSFDTNMDFFSGALYIVGFYYTFKYAFVLLTKTD